MAELKLKPKERSAILAGDCRAIRRESRPEVKDGEIVILSWTRGGKKVIDRETGETTEVARKPAFWIELKEPVRTIKKGETVWLIEFDPHDDREPIRLLSGGVPTGVRREPGLKTRLRSKPRAKGSEVESWTPETERGYGAGGKLAIDHLEAVDDATLAEYAQRSREGWAEYREEERAQKVADEEMRRLGNKLRRLQKEALRYGVDLTPQFGEWIATARREIVKQRNVA